MAGQPSSGLGLDPYTIVTMMHTMRWQTLSHTLAQLCVAGLLPLWAAAQAPAIHEEWIPMPDGVRLAANLLTQGGDWKTHRSPVILEYLPYRKDDWSIERDLELHSYWINRGYVVARVDIRGTGRSEGALPDREYSEQELSDGDAVIAWLAAQSWSNGNVGMMGISWGGFNSIQMAMRQPPALKAIIAVDATEDLFKDDIHYIDGLMHADEFELSMDLQTAMTRPPDFPVDEASLRSRFDAKPWFPLYLRHQRGGAFWDRASLRPDYARVKIPVFVVGGLYDGYRDNVPRMLQQLRGPRMGLLGPWNHTFPHDADPGPEIEWRALAIRWWDHWLNDAPNGIEREPMLTAYVRQSYPPSLALKEIPGAWQSFSSWPAAQVQSSIWFLTPEHGLQRTPAARAVHALGYVPSAGVEAGFWWGELTVDQRPLDAMSLTYDSPPLTQDLSILGEPVARLVAAASAPLADWMVRLEDVAPDGAVTLVTGAALNGAQRSSMSDPQPLVADQDYPLAVQLHMTSWIFPRGHRVRLAVSNALWPMIWPTPYPMTTQLKLGGAQGSQILLPVLTSPGATVAFSKPGPPPQLHGYHSDGDTWPGGWTATRDFEHQSTRVRWAGTSKTFLPWGEEDTTELIIYDVANTDPAKSAMHGEASTAVKLSGRTLTWSVILDLTSDRENFYYSFRRKLTSGDQLLRERAWTETIPRDLQ